MKRLLAAVLCLCTGLSACSFYPSEDYPYYDMPISNRAATSLFAYSVSSLEEAEEHANLIVRGRIMERRSIDDDHFVPPHSWIYSSLEIMQVYSGVAMPGERIWLAEGAYTYVSEGETRLSITLNNMPSELGKEYLFLLSGGRAPEGHPLAGDRLYSSVLHYGRFPALPLGKEPDDLSREELYIWCDGPSFREAFRKAARKYQ